MYQVSPGEEKRAIMSFSVSLLHTLKSRHELVIDAAPIAISPA